MVTRHQLRRQASLGSLSDDRSRSPGKKAKKKKPTRAGSHLSKELARSPNGTAVEPELAESPAPIRAKKNANAHTQIEDASAACEGAINNVQPAEDPQRPTLTKKPSIVREEPEREEEEAQQDREEQLPKRAEADPTIKNASKTSAANGQPKTPEQKAKKKVQQRVASESPARSTRFASAADQLVVKHDPPPRSLSPRKSALKHSSPTRAATPSDDGSELSTQGLSAEDASARKKSARVSWNDRNTVVTAGSVTVGSAEPTKTTPVQLAIQPKKKVWQNIVPKPKKQGPPVEEGETMSPRPTLPSFGSVREKKAKGAEERPLVRPNEKTQNDHNAAAPENIDDRSSHSSGDSLLDDTSEDLNESFTEAGTETSGKEISLRDEADEGTVPSISISQASPQPAKDDEQFFDDAASNGATTPSGAGNKSSESDGEEEIYSDAYSDATNTDADGFMSLDAVLESPPASPTLKNAQIATATANKTAEPSIVPEMATTEDGAPNDWENAKAYWKSLSLEKRRQLEQEAIAEGDDDKAVAHDKPEEEDQHGGNSTPESSSSSQRVYQITPGTSWDAKDAGKKALANGSSQMRSSMRETESKTLRQNSAQKEGFRKSMRDGRPSSAGSATDETLHANTGSTGMSKTLRARPATADTSVGPRLAGGGRPASYHPDTATSQKSAVSNPQRGSNMQRRGSDSSESSFKRARARSGSEGAREFRRSMRAAPSDAATNNADSNRFSLRSLSPTAFRRNSVSSVPSSPQMGTARMRQSLRGESVDAVTRRRSLFPRSGKSSKTRSGSRFADSSDEEDGGGGSRLFSSRFADSSDEEDAATPTIGKSFPKSLRSKSSRATASAIDIRSSTIGFESPDIANQVGIITQPKRNSIAAASHSEAGTPVKPGHTRRGSFMSMLRRKKDNAENTPTATPEPLVTSAVTGESWPLPAPDPSTSNAVEHPDKDSSDDRPSTAGGQGKLSKGKSKYLRRRSASQGMVGLGHEPIAGADVPDVPGLSPQKKKKFGTLRKMFGLHN